MLQIDLGCGSRKQPGFVGIDRFAMPGVDIVADLDSVLPVADSSANLIYASHSLEHVGDLMATMREIFRIGAHGAQVCIVAPYNEQKLNLANPYHLNVFNEHTPRFWTDHPEAPIDLAEYFHPHAERWGLARSDNSNPGLDLRLVRMEFFYFPEYRNLSAEQQRAMRKERLDACDQIMYHLIVWKGNDHSPERSFADHVSAFELFEPNYVKQRKARERVELFQAERDQARSQIVELQSQLADASNSTRRVSELEKDLDRAKNHVTDMRSDNHLLRMQLAGLFEKNEVLGDQFHATKTVLAKSQAETTVLTETLTNLRQENVVLKDESKILRSRLENLELIKAKMSLLKAELQASNGLLAWYQSQQASWNCESSRMKEELADAHVFKSHWDEGKRVVGELYSQVTAYRSSRLSRLASFFVRKDMLWEAVSPVFNEIKSYSAQHFRRSSRARFVLSDDLGNIPYREYAIPFKLDSLSKVSLAIRPLLSSSQGIVGVEVISSAQRVVAQVSLPLSGIHPDGPTDFIMPTPLVDLGEAWSLRVFVKNVEVPVAVYELLKYSTFNRRIDYMPFVFLR
jgi:SAM-dependent methyltransferase